VAYAAKIIADSISEAGDRLTTFEVTYPRPIHSEMMTHRNFSRNAGSSRAIPVEKMIRNVLDDPFIPIYWGKNQKGMQAEVELDETDQLYARQEWDVAMNRAVECVKNLQEIGVHKQIANRLLEPFSWITVIITATEWSNFFALRANPMAQPEIRKIAEMMKDLYETNTPKLLKYDEWHLPYITEEDFRNQAITCVSAATREAIILEDKKKVSAARCARVSYLTHDGKRDIQADLDLYERLVSGGHLSPLEHVATPQYFGMGATLPGYDNTVSYYSPMIGNFKGWKQLRKFILNEDDFSKVEQEDA
jgi:thymidylate synthase ThyX